MVKGLHLPLRHRKEIVALLNKYLPGVEVWVYGSRVNGRSHDGSDLDLVLRGPKLAEIDTSRIADFIEALQDSTIPFLVEARDWARLPESFHHEVEREHVALVGEGESGTASGRRYIPASEFCASVRDGTHDSPKPVERGRKLVTSRHLTTGQLDLSDAYLISEEDFEYINKRSKVDKWDVLISMIGTVGEPCLIKEEPDFAIKNIGLFKTRSEADGKWLYYYFRSKAAQKSIKEQSRGTTQQYIPLGALRDFPILITDDLEEQKTVVHILGTLDDKIELNRRMNETLEAMARALFKSWFVDFDPVRAKMAGRDTGLPQVLADLFPDRLVNSDLGEIPEGWEIGTVSQLAERIQNGGTPKRSEPTYWEHGEIPWLISSEVRQSFVLGTQNFISEKGLEKSSAKMVPARSILVALYGATAGQVSMNYRPLSTNQAVTAVIPSMGNRYFCLVGLKLEVSALENRAVGSAQQNISKKVVEETIVLLPQIELRSACDVLVESLVDRIFYSLHETQTLSDLRDALLPKLISGALRVEHTSNQ